MRHCLHGAKMFHPEIIILNTCHLNVYSDAGRLMLP